jgi:hypothetical protein
VKAPVLLRHEVQSIAREILDTSRGHGIKELS